MDSSVTLWQFLVQLLLDPRKEHLIRWTSDDGEFKLLQAEEVARLWGVRKNKPSMNYDKLSRALRYYYDKDIIKKVNGQKFVYRFVRYPEILSQEPSSGCRGRALLTGVVEPLRRARPPGIRRTRAGERGAAGQASSKTSSRNDYIHSGLYTSFTLNSLHAHTQLFKSIKVENPKEKLAAKKPPQEPPQSVIKFGTAPSWNIPVVTLEMIPKALPPVPQAPPPAVRTEAQEPHVKRRTDNKCVKEAPPSSPPPTVPSVSSPFPSPTPGSSSSPSPSLVPDSSQELVIDDTDVKSVSSQPPELQVQPSQDTQGSPSGSSGSSGSNHSGKAKKPKGLELTPTLVVTSSEPSPLSLASPSLPTASLTPAFLQTPTLLLTPSPLLSNIHFWSTLSPVAPLSPARRQGAHTLFQFPSVFNSHLPLPIPNMDGSNTPGPLSPDPQRT